MSGKRIIAALLLLITALFCCSDPKEKVSIPTTLPEPVSAVHQDENEKYPLDKFLQAIDSLKKINYFISGKDSVVSSKDPTDFIEMNGIRFCFDNPFDNSDSGLVIYKAVDNVRKFHVAKNKYQHGPSANIVQIGFVDTLSAVKWYDRLNQCKNLQIIKMKPKTDVWLQGQFVYFIQSYYDPSRHILNEITSEFRRHIE